MSFESLDPVSVYAILWRAVRRFIDAVAWVVLVLVSLAIFGLTFWGSP